MVDKTLVLRKFAQLEEHVDRIREYSSVTAEGYASDWKTQRIVERTLQIMIELCIDIAGHIISDKKLRVPVSYADTFKSLADAGIISSEVCGVMEKMAKFRNVVVHQYDNVDITIVCLILHSHLDDFLVFRDAILKMFGKQG